MPNVETLPNPQHALLGPEMVANHQPSHRTSEAVARSAPAQVVFGSRP